MKNSANEIMAEFYKLLKISANQLQTIKINDTEKKIFELLLAVSNTLPKKPILRVAGGWVRDKLLGRDNKDIDIALDTTTGAEFATAVVEYMRSIGEATKNIGVIKSNPEQSKHLETATTFIYGLPIDFVNLRQEVYDEGEFPSMSDPYLEGVGNENKYDVFEQFNTRIPTMKPATAEEDAFRRDLTINSLFYNINTGKVEDFTGKGIEDLKNGIIRTPLPSLKTFTDDPLRALRAIRFASRYGFKLDPELIEAARDPRVKKALQEKISRERIAEELRGMFKSPNPAMALELAKELGLRDELFPRPEGLDEWDMDQNNPHHDMGIYDHLVKVVDTMNTLLSRPGHDVKAEDRVVLLLAAFMHDLGKLEPSIKGTKQMGDLIVSTYYGHEEHSHRIAHHIMKELKMSNEEIVAVLRLLGPAGQLENVSRQMDQGIEPTRKFLASLVQKLGDAWKHAVYLAMSDHSSKKKNEPGLNENLTKNYYKLIERIENDQALANAHKTKPLLNGNEIAAIMNMKPGPALGVVNRALGDWHLSNLDATKQEAIDFIKKEFAGKTEEDLTALAPLKKKRSERMERLKKLGEEETRAYYRNGYLSVPAEKPVLDADELAALPHSLLSRGEYHITLISPPEMRALSKAGNVWSADNSYPINGVPKYRGLGKVMDGNNTAYFMVVDWPEAQEMRARYGLPPKDFHITIGFTEKDILDVPKNKTLKEE